MSLNFSISEFIKSDIAIKHNINNMPDIQSLDCILDLIVNCLQPLRNALNRPIIITSGFRSTMVNKLAGGVPTSQHTKGQAADFYIKGMTVNQIIEFIKNSTIEYDQLINEYNKWVHISFVKGSNRRQNLKIT
ncbi:DUF882 domain-containing protein [bacterium]|nr:DUF882 domain-containing protein [bacterium]